MPRPYYRGHVIAEQLRRQAVQQRHVDIQRLWKRMPISPQAYIGEVQPVFATTTTTTSTPTTSAPPVCSACPHLTVDSVFTFAIPAGCKCYVTTLQAQTITVRKYPNVQLPCLWHGTAYTVPGSSYDHAIVYLSFDAWLLTITGFDQYGAAVYDARSCGTQVATYNSTSQDVSGWPSTLTLTLS